MALLGAFASDRFTTSGADISFSSGGNRQGPPLLLLHGYPQTRLIWHAVAPLLAEHFFLVMPDLRGYGESSKPEAGENFINYSKREMARDMVEVMQELGHERFLVAGHDRGGRVAHRLALDWPDNVERLSVLDIAPTREMYAATDMAFARAYWHWFFLIQPAPLPENMIAGDPQGYLFRSMKVGGDSSLRSYDHFHEEAAAAYLAALSDHDTVHAMCNDYRAAASIDLVHDDEDEGHKITCPLHVIWGKRGVIERCFDPLALWAQRAEQVSGEALDCSHYIPEERPAETAAALLAFFKS